MKPSYKEAYRYLTNAEELLKSKAGRDNGFYKDRKYVRLAGHAAWMGVLVAIDEFLSHKNIKKEKGRKSKEWYEVHLSKLNKKLNAAFINAYDGLHLTMSYDGNLIVKVAEGSLDTGRKVIRLCEQG